MRKSEVIKLKEEFLLSLVLIMMSVFVFQSCQKEVAEINEEVDINEEEVLNEDGGCSYIFAEGLDNIYGTWAPEIVIDNETGDSIFYEIGEGHMGHMLEHWYSDSFELRDNGEFNIFYISMGKPCEDESFGKWEYGNMMINFFFFNQDTVRVPVILIEEDQLIIEDIINHKESEVILRRIN